MQITGYEAYHRCQGMMEGVPAGEFFNEFLGGGFALLGLFYHVQDMGEGGASPTRCASISR